MKRPISPEQFVIIWQTSKTKDEACKRLGITPCPAAARARYFRKMGVNLKAFKDPHDWDQLKKLAQRTAP